VVFKTTAIDHSAISPHQELSLGILQASLFHHGSWIDRVCGPVSVISELVRH
jgi:hypothetical protein